MFANSQMLGVSSGFPDNLLTPSKPSSSWIDQVMPSSPAPQMPSGGGVMGGFGSFLPLIDPALAGGVTPSAPKPSPLIPNLPGNFLSQIDSLLTGPRGATAPVSSFQQQQGLPATGNLDTKTVDDLKSAR